MLGVDDSDRLETAADYGQLLSQLLVGDARHLPLSDASVHCVITSPPYWSLRDYGLPAVVWDAPATPGHEHQWESCATRTIHGDDTTGWYRRVAGAGRAAAQMGKAKCGSFCYCGAWLGTLGLEPTVDLYIKHLVEVFEEVKRVLRNDGLCFLNIGDCYDSKTKQRWLVPHRLALALQARGWIVRSDIIWAKGISFVPSYAGSVMPESVRDRPTCAHEHILMLAKGEWVGPPSLKLAEKDAVWLAAMVDTEGTITINQKADGTVCGAQVSVANTKQAIIDKVGKLAACGSVHTQDGTNFPLLVWQATHQKAEAVLWEILPHLIGKKKQALIALELQASNGHKGNRHLTEDETQRKQFLKDTIHLLNKGVDVDLGDINPTHRIGGYRAVPYFYDYEAIREPGRVPGGTRGAKGSGDRQGNRRPPEYAVYDGARNPRDVWAIGTKGYRGAHFATFPPKLVEPLLRAGTSAYVCSACGTPYSHVVSRSPIPLGVKEQMELARRTTAARTGRSDGHTQCRTHYRREVLADSYQRACSCPNGAAGPALVLDPFMGSGTVGLVAKQWGRQFIGIDAQPKYLDLAAERIRSARWRERCEAEGFAGVQEVAGAEREDRRGLDTGTVKPSGDSGGTSGGGVQFEGVYLSSQQPLLECTEGYGHGV